MDLFDGSAARKKQFNDCLSCLKPMPPGEVHVCQPQAASRATDPATSFEAARRIEQSGKADSDREKCMAVLRKHPGLTSGEIAELAGLERHASARRLPELRRAGRVRNGESRKCRLTGTSGLTWWVLETK